jgi:hypothetical protein
MAAHSSGSEPASAAGALAERIQCSPILGTVGIERKVTTNAESMYVEWAF